MSFTQHVVDCRDHGDDCAAIVCTRDEDGTAVWTSHAPADIDPAGRINPDVPALDKRGQQSIRVKGEKLAPS